MRLQLDLETYSDLDLKDVGVYRYVEHPSFEVLMAGYSIDGAPAEVVEGEALIDFELTDYLLDPDVLKVAHNVNFDRVALSAMLAKFGALEPGQFLDPAQWSDTMARAAVAGYPRKLEVLAKTLETTPKDTAGTHLINYFAKPYRGKRRTKDDDAERWQKFLDYCRQDVDTLVEIDDILPDLDAREQSIWVLDQRINDRGIEVDMEFARWAHEQDKINSKRAKGELEDILDIENAGSVQQVRAGLESIGLELPNLQSDTVKKALESPDVTEQQKSALLLRQEISLTAAKKYKAAILMSNDDHRFRGGFSYHGAITGRWCLTGDHEVLTRSGWQRLDQWSGGDIAVWNPHGEISFQRSNAVSFPYTGDMLEYTGTRIKQVSTPDHKMPVRNKNGRVESRVVEDLPARSYIPIRGYRDAKPHPVDDELRVLVMAQADGTYHADGQLSFHFKKSRKVERCKTLLRRVGVPFTVSRFESTGATKITVAQRAQPVWLAMFRDKQWGPWLWDRNPAIFFDELEHWDGHRGGPNSVQYGTSDKHNADMVQAFAHLSGLFCRVVERKRTNENWAQSYAVNVWLDAPDGHELRERPQRVPFDGTVYCAETPTGYFLVRRNGSVWVTGNSGRGIQLQNLPRAQTDYPNAAIADSRLGLGTDAETLKAMVRPMLTGPFIVSDFSAIEARVLAWIAGETWAIEAFRDERDIYVETANRMGGLTRDQGKVAVLALGYAGGVGSLRSMGAQGDDAELDAFKNGWRKANRAIVRFWYDLEDAFEDGSGVVGAGHVAVSSKGNDRFIHLPSGRALAYRNVRRERFRKKMPDGSFESKNALRFSSGPVRVETYSGKLAENVTQAIARDLLADSLLELDRRGYHLVGHVHDEVIIEDLAGEQSVEAVERIMSVPPKWAEGLPLAAEGFRTYRYRKG